LQHLRCTTWHAARAGERAAARGRARPGARELLHACAARSLGPQQARRPEPARAPRQADALNVPGVLAGRNLVYSAPTSAGKSAVAEVLLLRRLLAARRPALLALPFVSLCAEKVAHLERLLAPLHKRAPLTLTLPLLCYPAT